MFASLAEIKAANKAAGLHFFDVDSMRFFRSRIDSDVINGRFFVTSEQFVGSDGVADARSFTVRRANDDGTIGTINLFQSHTTLEAAIAAAEEAS